MELILLAIVVVGLGYGIVTYNGLTRLSQLADNAWSDIDVQLKRRHDLIPAVVDVVKGHAGYERQVLEDVVSARGRALEARGPAALGTAERGVTGALDRLFALAEAYPDLKAVQSFLDLQRTLSEVEDHVQNARRYYNAVVRDLNTKIAQFPSSLVANLARFRSREFFGLDDPAERAAPRVGLGPSA